MKRFWQFLIVMIFGIALVGCGETGGGDTGGDGDGDDTPTGVTCADDPTLAKCSDPDTFDWDYNRTSNDFNGKGMIVKLLHGAPEEVDPENAAFSGDREAEKKALLYEIEKQYGIDLVIEKFPDEASWGPDRVAWIKSLAEATITDKGDIFAISSDWIPSLVEGKAIAELEEIEWDKTTKQYKQVGGKFSQFKYTQSQEKLKQYQFAKKVYGYSTGSQHADFFLYYNQDLITKYGLEDPATLWNEGRWDWTTFYNFLVTAQNAFDSSRAEGDAEMYAFGGWLNEIVRGALAARGGKFVDPDARLVLFTNSTTIKMYADLATIKEAGMWAPTANDVCKEFTAGNQLFQPAQLWFLSSTQRFASEDPNNPTCDFQISVVPYPTADNDGAAKEHYTIPMGSDSGYAIRSIGNEASGLTVEVLFNIIDDFSRGLKPEFNAEDMTDEQAYRIFLNKRIDSEASIEAIMSVENNISKYGYTDYLDIISKTVGNGSDWQGAGFYTWAHLLLNDGVDYVSQLSSYQPIYEDALKKILPEQ